MFPIMDDEGENLLTLTFDEWFDRVMKFEGQNRTPSTDLPPVAHILTDQGQSMGAVLGVGSTDDLKAAVKLTREVVAQQLAQQMKYVVVCAQMVLCPPGLTIATTPPDKRFDALVFAGQYQEGTRLEVCVIDTTTKRWVFVPEDLKPNGLRADFASLVDWGDEPEGPKELFPRVRG